MSAKVPDHHGTGPVSVGFDVRPLAGNIGAEIVGVDLTQPLDDEVVASIRATLLRWKVVFFRDQHLTQEQHIAFGRRFGDVTPAHPTLPAAFPDHPEILLLDNEQFARQEKKAPTSGTDDGLPRPPSLSIESRWHTDVTFVPNPPMGSILRGVVVPPYGGDTQWTNLAVAYERLSEPIKTMIDSLHAVHQNALPVARGELSPQLQQQFQSQDLRAVHPVVRVHPETGERSLFVNPNFTSHVQELSRQESRHLLAMLYEHMTNPEFTCRFRWEPNSVAMWDNRCAQHFAVWDYFPEVRHGYRVSVVGERPF